MLLSVTDAATMLGCSPRTVRSRLRRGELKGSKVGGRWLVARDALPLSAEARQALQTRADDIRELVEDSLPPALSPTRGDRRRTLADLTAFRAGAAVLRAVRKQAADSGTSPADSGTSPADSGTSLAAADHLEAALVTLGRAWPIFHPASRLRLLDEARSHVGAAMAALLLSAGTDAAPAVRVLEEQMLPALAGMCRAAERRR